MIPDSSADESPMAYWLRQLPGRQSQILSFPSMCDWKKPTWNVKVLQLFQKVCMSGLVYKESLMLGKDY